MPTTTKKRRREQVIAHTRSVIDELKSTCDGISTKSSNIAAEVSASSRVVTKFTGRQRRVTFFLINASESNGFMKLQECQSDDFLASPVSADTRAQSSVAVEDAAVLSTQSTAFDDQQSSSSFDRNEPSSSSASVKSITSRSVPLGEEGQKDVSSETTEDTAKMSAVPEYEAPSQSSKSNLPPWLRTQPLAASISSTEPAVVNVPDQSIHNESNSSSETSTDATTPTLIPHQRPRHEHMFASPHPQAEDTSNISVASARRSNLNPVTSTAAQRLSAPTDHLFLPVTSQSQLTVTSSESSAPVNQPPSFTLVDPNLAAGSAAHPAQRPTFTHGGGIPSGAISPATFQHFGSQGRRASSYPLFSVLFCS